ncbi:DUF748 domain-containing protein [Shewanella sp. 125m-7]
MSFIKQSFQTLLNGYRQRPKYQRLLIIVTAIYFTFTAILGLLVPYIVVKQVPEQLSSLLQRPVTLENVKINPFTLEVAIDKFELQETDNKPFVGFSQLSFEYQFWDSVFNTAFSIAHVTLTAPVINVERLNTPKTLRFNFSDIIETLANRPKDKSHQEPTTSAGIPHFILTNLAIVNADLNFTDNLTHSQLHYPELNLNIKYFDSNHAITSSLNNLELEQKTNHYSIHVVGRNGGEITTQGLVQLSPLNIVGDVQLTNIQLPQFWSFISAQFTPQLTSGKLSLSSHYQLQMQETKLQFTTDQGMLKLADINFEYQNQSIIKLPVIALRGIEFNLKQRSVTAETLDTQGLVLNAKLNKNGINLATIFSPINATPNDASAVKTNQDKTVISANQAQTTKSSWTAILKGIKLKDYQVNLSEQLVTQNTLWKIDNIELTTGAINADLASPIDYQLSLNVNQQGLFASSGHVDALKQLVNAKVSVTNFALPQIQNYLKPYVNIELKQGKFSTEGNFSFNAQTQQLGYTGSLGVNDLLIKDTLQKKDLIKWKSLEVNHLAFDKNANSINIDHVALNQPYGRIIIAKDKSTNIGDLLVVQTAADPENETETVTQDKAVIASVSTKQGHEQAKPSKPLALTINKISFKEGSTFFADNSLTPNFAASIEYLDGNISKLSSNSEQTATVDIKGKIDRYAPVSLKGDINPLLKQPYLDLALNFKHVELTSISPYSGTYAGYYIDKGLLSLALNYRLDNSQLVGENHLVIDQLKLGKPSDSSLATTLPVTLAIALLQNRHGVIDLGLKVSGDVDDPSFSIGSIVMTAFTNVITKAVTAPFTLLAGLLDSDEEKLDKVSFAAGNAILDDSQQTKLNKLAQGLIDRPMLTLSIKGGVNMLEDSKALREHQLKAKLAQTAKLDITTLPADLSPSHFPTTGPLSDALIKLYETELASSAQAVKDKIEAEHKGENKLNETQLTQRWHIALYNFVLSAQRLPDAALGHLAQQRAIAVKTFLIAHEKIEPQRIFLLDSQVDLSTGSSQATLTLGAN